MNVELSFSQNNNTSGTPSAQSAPPKDHVVSFHYDNDEAMQRRDIAVSPLSQVPYYILAAGYNAAIALGGSNEFASKLSGDTKALFIQLPSIYVLGETFKGMSQEGISKTGKLTPYYINVVLAYLADTVAERSFGGPPAGTGKASAYALMALTRASINEFAKSYVKNSEKVTPVFMTIDLLATAICSFLVRFSDNDMTKQAALAAFVPIWSKLTKQIGLELDPSVRNGGLAMLAVIGLQIDMAVSAAMVISGADEGGSTNPIATAAGIGAVLQTLIVISKIKEGSSAAVKDIRTVISELESARTSENATVVDQALEEARKQEKLLTDKTAQLMDLAFKKGWDKRERQQGLASLTKFLSKAEREMMEPSVEHITNLLNGEITRKSDKTETSFALMVTLPTTEADTKESEAEKKEKASSAVVKEKKAKTTKTFDEGVKELTTAAVDAEKEMGKVQGVLKLIKKLKVEKEKKPGKCKKVLAYFKGGKLEKFGKWIAKDSGIVAAVPTMISVGGFRLAAKIGLTSSDMSKYPTVNNGLASLSLSGARMLLKDTQKDKPYLGWKGKIVSHFGFLTTAVGASYAGNGFDSVFGPAAVAVSAQALSKDSRKLEGTSLARKKHKQHRIAAFQEMATVVYKDVAPAATEKLKAGLAPADKSGLGLS